MQYVIWHIFLVDKKCHRVHLDRGHGYCVIVGFLLSLFTYFILLSSSSFFYCFLSAVINTVGDLFLRRVLNIGDVIAIIDKALWKIIFLMQILPFFSKGRISDD